VTAPSLIAHDDAVVKAELLRSFSELLDPVFESARTGELTSREAERRAWRVLVEVGALLLTALFAAICRRATVRAVEESGLDMFEVRLRMDGDYWAKLKTTFGLVSFPWFAFRWRERTHVPARELFPLYGEARSSEMLLEWESSLASDHPFRKAQEALLFFSHCAADVEDTTIERHAVIAGKAIPPEWLYLAPDKIREVLTTRAVRDTKTGRPLVHVSTDAHALRLYVDETWAAKWKMVNGIRLWCTDRLTGQIVHLGGEFIPGDYSEVVKRLHDLDRMRILPFDGNYGNGVRATVCVVTDGLDWIAERVVPLYKNALLSLDPYHVVEQVTDAAHVALPKARATQLIKDARTALGIRDRRGRTHLRKGQRRVLHRARRSGMTGSGRRLLSEVLEPLVPEVNRGKRRFGRLLAFVRRNLHRLDYGELRRRGAQIGSGAMESLHRTGSQLRMKRAGCRWTAGVAHAILNLRMLTLSGRWDEYWAQPGLAARMATGGAD
jgi:hypothetical protein